MKLTRPSAKRHAEIVANIRRVWADDVSRVIEAHNKRYQELDTQCDAALERVMELEIQLDGAKGNRDHYKEVWEMERTFHTDERVAHAATTEKLALADKECAYYRDLLRTMVAEAARLRHGADKPKVTEIPKDSILVGDKSHMWSIPEKCLEDAVTAVGWKVVKP